MPKQIKGHVLTPNGFVHGHVTIADGRITAVAGAPVSEAQVRASDEPIVLPGFIDTHVHGGGGRDTMEGGDAAFEMARMHVRHGTTSMLATTMTAPLEEIRVAMCATARPRCWPPR
ncbi:MAG TPA: amidohydrolase family protein [Burkholderiaceae bacterium]